MYFECSLKYWADDMDSPVIGKRKQFVDVIACCAENYTDAEAIATQWGLDNIEEDFRITPIKEINVSGIYYRGDKTGKWFKMSCEYYTETKEGAAKTNKISFLVQAKDQKEAYDRTRVILEEEGFTASEVKKNEETKIIEYVV